MSKVKTCYNLDLLKQCIERDSPKDVEIPEKISSKHSINFIECGVERISVFRTIYTYGMKCRECMKNIGKEKIK